MANRREEDPLKPCPFCGGRASNGRAGNHCEKVVISCLSEACPASVYVYDDSTNGAISKWNTRAEPRS